MFTIKFHSKDKKRAAWLKLQIFYSMIILKKALITYKHSTVNGYLRQCRIAEEVALISMVPYASEIIKHFERTGTMKRILAFLLVSVLIFGICGCAKSNKEEAAANDLFTDEFFSDVVRIRCVAGIAEGSEQMAPVIRYLKSLKLKETNEHLRTTNEKGELLYGLGCITFDKADGTDVSFLYNNGKFTLTGNSPKSYVIQDVNFDEFNLGLDLHNAFEEGNGTDTEK